MTTLPLSCSILLRSSTYGFGVPLYAYQGERSQLVPWAEKKGEAGLAAYHQQKNRISIDGLLSAIAHPTEK